MPEITVTKDTSSQLPEKIAPTIYFEVVVSRATMEAEVYPSTFINTGNDYMTADEVMARLAEDYNLNSLDGVLDFMSDQSWVPEDLAITLTMYDIGDRPPEEE